MVSCLYNAPVVMYREILTYLYIHKEWVKAFTCITSKQERKSWFGLLLFFLTRPLFNLKKLSLMITILRFF